MENKGNTRNHDIISNSIKRGELAIENVPSDGGLRPSGILLNDPHRAAPKGILLNNPHRAGRFNS
jgi:hypothetical protein